MKTRTLYSILLMTLSAGILLAQGDAPKPAPGETAKFYRLDFAVKELEGGKVLNSRTYSTIADSEHRNVIRTGSRVPVSTSTGPGTHQLTYIDLGVNIDCSQIREAGKQLALTVSADLSTIAEDFTGPDAPGQPVIRQNKWNAYVLVPLRKPITLFSSDDATSKRQMQLELTATPLE